MKRLTKILVVFLLLSVFFVTCFIVFLNSPVDSKSENISVKFKVDKGASSKKIAKVLKEKKLIRSENFAYIYLRLKNISIKSGVYNLNSSLPTSSILLNLTSGRQELVRVTIPEGFTIKKTAKLLEEYGLVSAEEFEVMAKNKDFLNELGIFAESSEGFLFPDTYFFGKEASSKAILKMMTDNFFLKVSQIRNFPIEFKDIYDKVVLASIIEREYQIPEEAPIISGVFENRLNIKMPLQSCATVEYIITEIQNRPHPKRLFWNDIEIKNEYNTYINYGLPPGPISNPGLTALNAACNPAKTDYIYFRLINAETGKHAFSKNFDDHAKAGNSFILNKK